MVKTFTRYLFEESRPWTILLWAFALACLVSGADLARRSIAREAASRPLLLLPARDFDREERARWAGSLIAEDDVASARWLSPRELAQQTSRSVPRDLWSTLFSEDDAWLPWLVEIRFRDPVAEPEAVRSRIASLQANADWRLVLWDGHALKLDSEAARRIDALAWPAAALVFLLGVCALAFGPLRSAPFRVEISVGSVAVLASVGGAGLAARAAEIAIDGRSWSLALGVGFALAALLAPVIKGRTPTKPPPAATSPPAPTPPMPHE